MKKIFWFVIGILLLIVGVAGLVLPILPGWYLIFAGLCIVAPATAFRIRRALQLKFLKSDVLIFQEWKSAGVHAGITTRHFPLKIHKADDFLDPGKKELLLKYLSESKTVREEKVRFDSQSAYLHQVHGERIAVIDGREKSEDSWIRLEETDAAVTREARITLFALTADCLPVYLMIVPADPTQEDPKARWIGVVHAGWRGTQMEITSKTARILLEKSSAKPSELFAMFGPCIGPQNYRVGPEFKSIFPGGSVTQKGKRHYFDLVRENEGQLLKLGVPLKNIIRHSFCTIAQNKHFYSFRKERNTAGRMVSFIQLQQST